MASVILCDCCERKVYGPPKRWELSSALRNNHTDQTVDLCPKCWDRLSALVWKELDKKYQKHLMTDEEITAHFGVKQTDIGPKTVVKDGKGKVIGEQG